MSVSRRTEARERPDVCLSRFRLGRSCVQLPRQTAGGAERPSEGSSGQVKHDNVPRLLHVHVFELSSAPACAQDEGSVVVGEAGAREASETDGEEERGAGDAESAEGEAAGGDETG